MLHLLARVAHVRHLLQLLAGLPVLGDGPQLLLAHHEFQLLADTIHHALLKDPVVPVQADIRENIL